MSPKWAIIGAPYSQFGMFQFKQIQLYFYVKQTIMKIRPVEKDDF